MVSLARVYCCLRRRRGAGGVCQAYVYLSRGDGRLPVVLIVRVYMYSYSGINI